MSMEEFPLVLVTEVNAIVGIDLCEALREAGYRVVGPVATVADVEAYLEREQPDFAVIEPWLKDGSCAGTMERLRQRGVPFVVDSVSTPDEPIGRNFANVPWLSKPATPWDVVIALDGMAMETL